MTDPASPWAPLADSERRVVLELLVHGPLARTELADRLRLSAPSLTRLTRPLLTAGIIGDALDAPTHTGGRPLQPLAVDPDLQHFVGIKLTGSQIHGVLTNLRADIETSTVEDIEDRSPEAVTTQLSDVVTRLTRTTSPAAVGIGLGGVVRDSTLVHRAPFLLWHDVDLGEMVSRATGLPCIISNDLDALMEAEHWFGDGRDVRSFATLTIGAGVGGGLIIHDRLVTGPDSGIGLLGHFPLDPFGPACPDGHRGCAMAMLTSESMRAQAMMLLGRPVGYEDLLDMAQLGDPVVDQVVGRSAHALGVLIAAVANIAQPERIILTGEGIRLAHVGRHRMEEAIRQSRDPLASDLDLRIIDEDPFLWARGAAAVAIQRTVLEGLAPE